MKRGGRFIDEMGNTHNWLKVLEFAYSKKNVIYWKCECICGKIKTVSGRELRSGHTKSCGCYWYSDEVQQKISRKGFKHSEKTKREMSKNRKGVPKSKEHRESIGKAHEGEKSRFFGKFGKDSPRWNPNLTDEDRERSGRIYGIEEWRCSVYKRDNYTCQKCGNAKGGNLNAHHIESYNSNKELRTVLLNGVTLCKDCHKDFHHQYGCGDNTREQWEEFNENSA